LKGDISIRELYDHRMGDVWIGTFSPFAVIGKAVSFLSGIPPLQGTYFTCSSARIQK
jgi:hypothetical protein